MAVPGEQESFKSQSFSKPSKSTSTSARTGTRRVFFNNRPDISDDRLERRQKQFDELRAFKNDPTKTKAVNIVDPVTGKVTGTVTGLTQAATAGGKTVAQREQELAFKYGPTFREIGSDMGYAMGSMAKGAGDAIMSGNIGILGVIKGVYNYATDKVSNAYNSLTDVQKEIADNPNKYTFAEQQEKVKQLRNFRDLASEANKDALGLEIDFLRTPGSGYQAGAGLRSLPEPKISLEDDNYVESGQFREDLQKSGIITVDDPATQEPLPDSTEIPGYNATIGILKERLKDQGFNDLQIQSAVNQVTQQILSGEYTGDMEFETGSTTRGSELQSNEPGGTLGGPNLPGAGPDPVTGYPELFFDEQGSDVDLKLDRKRVFEAQTVDSDFETVSDDEVATQSGVMLLKDFRPESRTQVTAYNNPVNLMDVGQAGATGEIYGNGFAVFPDAQSGILAAKNDLAIKTERYGGNVDEIIGEFAPESDNPDSFNNYVNFVKQGVGDTVDPGEEDELLRRVIQFENKPDIAQQYLAMVAEGGLMDKKMYGGIISSKS